MGRYKFGLKMLMVDIKQSSFYLISVIFSAAVIFNAFNVMYNNSFTSIKGEENQVLSLLLLVLIIAVMLFTFFANSFFIMGKTKEMAIAALNGVWSYKLVGFLGMQNLIVAIVGSILGLLLGMGLAPIFLSLTYRVLNLSGNIWSYSPQSFLASSSLIIGLICPYLIFGDFLYVTGKEIKDLIGDQRQVYQPDTRTIKIPKVTYFIVYLVPLVSLFISSKRMDPSIWTYFNIFFSLYGTQGVIRYFLPDIILRLKREKFINDKIKLISFSNLHYSLRKLNFLMVALSVISVILVNVAGIYRNSPRVKIMSMFLFVSVIFLIALSVIYKIMIEVVNRRYIFKQLKLVGYTTEQIIRIIGHEVRIFYSVAIGLPLFHILIYLITFSKAGFISMTLFGAFSGSFVFIFAVSGIISYKVYKKLVLNYI